MKVERLDLVVIDVKDIDEAVKFFSDLFETPFEKLYAPGRKFRRTVISTNAEPVEEKPKHSMAMSPFPGGLGLELIQDLGLELSQDPASVKQGLRSLAFKVADLEQAKTEMKEKGIRLVYEVHIGDYKAVVFNADDTYGVRIGLTEYKGDNVADAIMKGLIE